MKKLLIVLVLLLLAFPGSVLALDIDSPPEDSPGPICDPVIEVCVTDPGPTDMSGPPGSEGNPAPPYEPSEPDDMSGPPSAKFKSKKALYPTMKTWGKIFYRGAGSNDD